MPATMIHRRAGNAQIGLSYSFLAGFFVCLILQGLGYFKINIADTLREMAMLVLSFWFMRSRDTTSEPPPATVAPAPTPAEPSLDPTRPPQAAKPSTPSS